MYKVQLFEEKTSDVLQHVVNAWLSEHKDIAIAHSNITQTDTGHSFYLLYTTTELQMEELKEIAAEVMPENSVEATDINPEVLKATS